MKLNKFTIFIPILCTVILISSIILAQQVIITKRIMTDQEFYKLKEKEGIYEEGKNYNKIFNGYGTGLKPPTEKEWEEIRKMAVIVDKMEFHNGNAPPSHDNSTTIWFPPIGNQDGEGSCVSWACGYYTKTFQEAKEHNWDISGCIWEGGYYGHPSAAYQDKIFSPDFIYHQVNGGEDGGSYYSDNINLLYRIGGCTWDKMPYDPNNSTDWPQEDAWRQAPIYRSDTGFGYMWVQTNSALVDLKQFLADGNLAIISINADYYSNLTSNDLWTLDNYNPSGTNHANTIVGYDDNYGPYTESGNPDTYGALKVANSWSVGGSWENVADGFYYISYECMMQRVESICFYENRVGYEPEMIAVFQMSHNRRGECETTVGIGNTTSPGATKRFDDYNYNGGYHSFPANRMVMDITEFLPYISGPPDNFFLGIYDNESGTDGTIDFFSIEKYSDYFSGLADEVYISSDPPVNIFSHSSAYAQLITGENVIMVIPSDITVSWHAGIDTFTVFCSGSGTINWTASVLSGGSWLSIISGSSGTGDGIIGVNYIENSGTDRMGTIRVVAPEAINSPVDVTVSQSAYQENEALIWLPSNVPATNATAIQDALSANGKSSIITNDITSYYLTDFQYVFICLGIYSNNHVLSSGDSEVTQLINYLNAGGRLYMEGGDTWAYDEYTSLHAMFKITGLSDGSGDLHTILGSSCLEGMNYTYSGENSYIDQLAPQDTALIFHNNNDPAYTCGIAYDYAGGSYRTIGTSFQFSGLDDASASGYTKTDLMNSYLDFFDNGCRWTPPNPQNLYAFNGYHGTVPLAWDPPPGFEPLQPAGDKDFEVFMSLIDNPRSKSKLKECKKDNNEFDSEKQKPRIGKDRPQVSIDKQTLLTYNIYRSDSPGGPYTIIASNVERQYYRDETVSNGNVYYYAVTAVYDEGESNYSNEDDGIAVANGYYINSGWTQTPPVLDGFIDLAEWADAAVVNITSSDVYPSVTLYVMNDNSHLYIAVDDSGNTSLDEVDQIGIYFDENHDREWPSNNPSGEGNFWVCWWSEAVDIEYRGIYGWWPDNTDFDDPYNAPGVNGGISISSGHVQFEVEIDLVASELNATGGDVIGYLMGSLIMPEDICSGYWPQELLLSPWGNVWRLPAVYGDLELAIDDTVSYDFANTMTVSDNNANFIDLVFGTAPDATEGFDATYDQYAPLMPPSGLFDARFNILNDAYIKDFRSTNIDTITWNIQYQASSGGDPITLVWDSYTLPEGSFRLRDIYTGSLVNIDMKTQNSYNVTNPSITQLQIIYSLTTSFNKALADGWNLLCLPFDVADEHYLSVFPNAVSGTLYGFNGSYYQEDTFELGKGYWLKFPSAEDVLIEGFPVNSLNIDLTTGWNLIGPYEKEVPIETITSSPANIIVSPFYGYENGYYIASILSPGRGYWVKTNQAGELILPNGGLTKVTDSGFNLAEMYDEWSKIIVSDDEHNTTILYLTDDEVDLSQYELPPIPPIGVFDVRYDNGGTVAFLNQTEKQIKIQSMHYPVRVKVDGINLEVKDSFTGNILNTFLRDGEEITIANPNIQSLTIIPNIQSLTILDFEKDGVPSECKLFQNYPNPFNPSTMIAFSIPQNMNVKLSIYNIIGEQIIVLLNKNLEAGIHQVEFDAKNYPSSIYFYRLEAGDYVNQKKMLFMQ